MNAYTDQTARLSIIAYLFLLSSRSQGLVAIFLLFVIFHIMYDYTNKGANDEKKKF